MPSQPTPFPTEREDIRVCVSGEASTSIAAGKLVFVDGLAADGSIKRATASDVAVGYGIALETIAAGAKGRVQFIGVVPSSIFDASGFSSGNVLTPGTGGTLSAITTGQAVPVRVGRVISSTGQNALLIN